MNVGFTEIDYIYTIHPALSVIEKTGYKCKPYVTQKL
jgi:hypothetical protein